MDIIDDLKKELQLDSFKPNTASRQQLLAWADKTKFLKRHLSGTAANLCSAKFFHDEKMFDVIRDFA